MKNGLNELINPVKLADSETTKTDAADWIPADVYAAAIFEGVVEAEKLGDILAVREVRPDGQGGEAIQVQHIGARTAQGHNYSLNYYCFNSNYLNDCRRSNFGVSRRRNGNLYHNS